MPWSTNEIHDIICGSANVFIALGTLLLLVHFLSPLVGGKFHFNALVHYGSWIVFSLFLKLEAKSIRDRQFGGIKFYIANIFELLCILMWFVYPYNLLGLLLFLFLKLFGLKALKKHIMS